MPKLLDKPEHPPVDGRFRSFPFTYVNSAATNIRDTFERVDPAWNKRPEKPIPENVSSITKPRRKP